MERPEPLRILICDDDEALREVIAVALAAEGYRTAQASAFAEARAAVEAEQWALILLDTLGTLGTDRERQLADLCAKAEPSPVLIMTGWTDMAKWAEQTLPVAGVLQKPFDLDTLLQRVVEIVPPPAVRG